MKFVLPEGFVLKPLARLDKIPKKIEATGIVAHVLPTYMQTQTQSNWCWSAVGTSVGLLFQTGSWTQCDTANGCLGMTVCCNSPTPATCNVYGYLDQSLTYTKSFASMMGGTVAVTDIEAQLNMARPVGFRIAWTGGGAHFATFAGYSYPDTAPTNVTVYIQDPIYGTTIMAFTSFPASYHGGGSWTHTYYTKPQA